MARRGADGDSLDGFAARLGIDRTVLERAEAGECPLASLPASLRRLLSLSGTSEELPR